MPFSATDLLAELPRLRRYARILTDDPEHADRLVEETLLRFGRQQGESTSESARRTQLLSLLRAVNSEQTAPGMRPESLSGASLAGLAKSNAGPTEDAGTSPPDRGAEMLARLRALPLEQREVLVLVAVEQMSYTEIAALLRLPVATVMARLAHARETLRSRTPKPLSAPNTAK